MSRVEVTVLPDRGIFRHLAQAALVAALADLGVAFDELEILDLFAANKAGPPFLQRSLQMIMANVIRPAFQQRYGNRRLQRRAHGRNITIEQLVLQGLGAGGDDDFPAAQQRRNQIGKCFAGAGAGFRDQDAEFAAMVSAIACAISSCCARALYPDTVRASGPPGEKNESISGMGKVGKLPP